MLVSKLEVAIVIILTITQFTNNKFIKFV